MNACMGASSKAATSGPDVTAMLHVHSPAPPDFNAHNFHYINVLN